MTESTISVTRAGMRRERRRLTIAGVLGELLITAGVLVLLFLGWQLWFNDIVFGASQRRAADQLSEEWQGEAESAPDVAVVPDPGEPVVMSAPAQNTAFANLIVPRLGIDYKRPIAEGVGNAVLNDASIGIGHYPNTGMPGELGNFALSAHRTAYGGAFHNVHQLVVGDSIYVETKDGWYKYTFRNLEYVRADGVGVILPVPQQPGAVPGDAVISLITCNPILSTAERIIAYGVFESWFPRAGGAPAEISDVASAASAEGVQ